MTDVVNSSELGVKIHFYSSETMSSVPQREKMLIFDTVQPVFGIASKIILQDLQSVLVCQIDRVLNKCRTAFGELDSFLLEMDSSLFAHPRGVGEYRLDRLEDTLFKIVDRRSLMDGTRNDCAYHNLVESTEIRIGNTRRSQERLL
jgi:hypothetical protein